MQMPLSQEKRLTMFRGALQEKAPRTYRQLLKEGTLEQFLKDQDQAMMESYNPEEVAVQAARAGHDQKNSLKIIQDVNQALSQYTEQVLTTWLDLSDPPTTESPPES